MDQLLALKKPPPKTNTPEKSVDEEGKKSEPVLDQTEEVEDTSAEDYDPFRIPPDFDMARKHGGAI
jgi:hypothetical protein